MKQEHEIRDIWLLVGGAALATVWTLLALMVAS